MTLDIDTDHGYYQALPYRDADGGPAGAVLTVFRDGGSLVGFVSAARDGYVAHRAGGSVIERAATVEGAAAAVTEPGPGRALNV